MTHAFTTLLIQNPLIRSRYQLPPLPELHATLLSPIAAIKSTWKQTIDRARLLEGSSRDDEGQKPLSIGSGITRHEYVADNNISGITEANMAASSGTSIGTFKKPKHVPAKRAVVNVSPQPALVRKASPIAPAVAKPVAQSKRAKPVKKNSNVGPDASKGLSSKIG